MQIYLQSKEHGKKVAHAEEEARLDCMNGWKRVTEDEYFKRSKKANKEGTQKTLKLQTGQKDVTNINKIR